MATEEAGWTLLHEGGRSCPIPPRVTIAIPTFNRPALLRECLTSAVGQIPCDDYEILIVDNASEPDNIEAVRRMLDDYVGPALRYVVNDHNLGMFGNWNRCLELARGEWVTILSDDDLLRPAFLSVMMAALSRHPRARAIIARTAILDQRAASGPLQRLVTVVKGRVSAALRHRGRDHIQLTVQRLFWGNIAGSSLACLFHRATVLRLGGFDEQQFPSADFDLHLRLAQECVYLQLNEVLADTRLQVNETMKPETLHGFVVRHDQHRRRLLAQGAVPGEWRKWLAPLVGYEVDATRRLWNVAIDSGRLSRDLGVDEPPEGKWAGHPRLTWLAKMRHGGV